MERLEIRSPSKINLFLRVLRRRADGYHEILSLMQMVDLCDSLSLEPEGGEIEVLSDAPGVPQGHGNLAYRAAELLRKRTAARGGARIFIRKLIPVAAGLGGGSGNAAAVLLGLNALWGLGLTRRELLEMASELGSDVPFFLFGARALARGRGEVLESLPPETPRPVLLVRPRFEVSASWAYESLKMRLTSGPLDNSMSESLVDMENSLYINDLEPVVSAKYPVVAELRKRLEELGAVGACMSGSGPTVFGLFRDELSAEEACRNIKEEGNWVPYLSKTLSSLEEVYGAPFHHLGGN